MGKLSLEKLFLEEISKKITALNRILLLLILSIFIINCSAQKQNAKEINYIPYYLKVYEADSLYVTGNYERSYELLDSLFQKFTPLNQTIFYEMETYINVAYKTGNTKKVKPVLKQLISKWGYDYEYLSKPIKNQIKLAKKEIDSLKSVYKKKINWKLRDSVLTLIESDQKYHGNKQKYDAIDYIDSIHYKKILHWLKYGDLDLTTIGNPKRGENTDIGIVLIHVVDNDKNNELKEIVYQKVIHGKMPPINYALMLDRDLLNHNKPQKYNSFVKDFSEDKRKIFNKFRHEIGLYPVGYFDWRNDLLYQ